MEQWSLLKNLNDLKVEDFTNFVELSQLLSVRELARRRNTTPSKISRSLASLEESLGQKLMSRSATGLSLTEDGQTLFDALHRILEATENVLGVSRASEQLCLGSISFLSTRVVSHLCGNFLKAFSEARVIDFPPDELVAAGLRGAFNVGLHIGPKDWPQTWVSKKVGEISWTLCARKGHPLGAKKKLTLEEVLKYPFVYPVYWGKSGLVIGDDQFPVSMYKRKRGVATATGEAAAVVISETDHLGFLPDVIVFDEVKRGRMIALAPQSFKVTKPLYLTARADLITQKKFQFLQDEFGKFLGEVQGN